MQLHSFRRSEMVTVVQSLAFTKKVIGKYAKADVDLLIEALCINPQDGELFTEAGNLYRYRWELTAENGSNYDVVYVYHASDRPLVVVNIFRRNETALLDKTLACLATEICH